MWKPVVNSDGEVDQLSTDELQTRVSLLADLEDTFSDEAWFYGLAAFAILALAAVAIFFGSSEGKGLSAIHFLMMAAATVGCAAAWVHSLYWRHWFRQRLDRTTAALETGLGL